MTKVQRSLRVQFEKGESREETLLGRDYLVVPCIAMVEGVRFGAGQTEPELGLASEFGDTPISWANRPLVLNHPQINGDFVSANSPFVLENYQFGLTMNPEVKNNKLHLEAWIDKARVQELGGDFQTTYDRIVAEEEVEVSVGFFSNIDKTKGKFKGQSYGAIWRNIKPDHLAVLVDTIGACSVADGCGVPRLNEAKMSTTPKIKTDATTEPVKTQCSCGGNHAQEAHEDDEAPVTQKGLKQLISDLLKPFTQSAEEKALEAHISSGQRASNEALVAQAIAPTLMDNDIRTMISGALSKKYPNEYVYLLAFNQSVAVFEKYASNRFATYQLGIEVSETSTEFVGEPEEVILQTKIVPQSTQAEDDTTPATQKENDMADDPKDKEKTKTQEAVQEVPKLTAQQYIDNAPPEIQEALNSAMKLQADKKAAAIKTLQDAKTKLPEEFLKAQTLEVLEGMVDMLPPSYQGKPAPVALNANQGTGEDKATVPVPTIQWGKAEPAKAEAAA